MTTVPGHVNLTAYGDVENLDRFDESQFRDYCQAKLDGCDKHVSFIKKNIVDADPSWRGNMAEIGSGNSKLLYRLEKEGLLSSGLGYEVSRTRYLFAEKFREYAGSSRVVNCNADFFAVRPPDPASLDLVIAVDVVFQLLTPLFPEAEKDVIRWLAAALKPGGYALLELVDFQHFAKTAAASRDKEYRYWEQFPEHDPFEFMLARVSTDAAGDLVWEKTFLKRDSHERSSFNNVLRPYTPTRIKELFSAHGFDCRIFPCWNIPEDIDEGGFILLAKRKGGAGSMNGRS